MVHRFVLSPSPRRFFSRACLLVLGVASFSMTASPARAILPAALTNAQRTLIHQAEGKLSALRSLLAQFEQVTDNGAMASGTVAIKRPGKMRLDYDPPSQIRVIANGTHLIYIDQELDQVSYIGLESTPAGILLRDKVSFGDADILVTAVRQDSAAVEIDVTMRDDPGAGLLTLVFATSPFELRQWRVKDTQGVVTTVSLHHVVQDVPLADDRFYFVRRPRSRREK